MADMCKPRWKIAFFIFIYLLLFTKGKAKSRLSFQNGFPSLSSVVFLDAALEQFGGKNIVCAAANDSNYATLRKARGKAFTKARIQYIAGLGPQGINVSDRRWRFTDFKHSSLYLIDYPLFLITVLENVKTER